MMGFIFGSRIGYEQPLECQKCSRVRMVSGDRRDESSLGMSRRDFLMFGLGSVLLGLGEGMGSARADVVSDRVASASFNPDVRTLESGIKYIDFVEGNGPSPKWGDIVWVNYTTYAVVGQEKLEKLDASQFRNEPYLFKHGGGFTVKGMEEAVHTMKPGGRRRVLVPPIFGYVGPDLGPLPNWIMARNKLKDTLRKSTSQPPTNQFPPTPFPFQTEPHYKMYSF